MPGGQDDAGARVDGVVAEGLAGEDQEEGDEVDEGDGNVAELKGSGMASGAVSETEDSTSSTSSRADSRAGSMGGMRPADAAALWDGVLRTPRRVGGAVSALRYAALWVQFSLAGVGTRVCVSIFGLAGLPGPRQPSRRPSAAAAAVDGDVRHSAAPASHSGPHSPTVHRSAAPGAAPTRRRCRRRRRRAQPSDVGKRRLREPVPRPEKGQGEEERGMGTAGTDQRSA